MVGMVTISKSQAIPILPRCIATHLSPSKALAECVVRAPGTGFGDNGQDGLGLYTLRQGTVFSDENDVYVDPNQWVPRLSSRLIPRGVKKFVLHDDLHEVARDAIDGQATDNQETVLHGVNHPEPSWSQFYIENSKSPNLANLRVWPRASPTGQTSRDRPDDYSST